MDIKIGSKIHNRFDIEVRDKDTGELKQKGQAENIVLDRMYTRLCNFNSYFSYIHFGQGTGTLDPSRELLFDELGYKSAVTEDTVKDFPISKWTRKIVLNPEEYVGKSIKEVGISDTYSTTKTKSYINTHALIKDAEGNQLSIEKTDTDVIIIYATVFIELQNRNNNIYFTNLPFDNSLLNYLLGSSISTPNIQTGIGIIPAEDSINLQTASKVPSTQTDIINKNCKFYTRFGVSESNQAITEVGLTSILHCNLYNTSIFGRYNKELIQIGVGDGVKTEFYISDHSISNLDVKVDGSKVTNYSHCEELILNKSSNYFTKSDLLICQGYYAGIVSFTSNGDHAISWSRPYGGTNTLTIAYLKDIDVPKIISRGLLYSNTKVSDTGNYLLTDNSYYKLDESKALQISAEELPEDIKWTIFTELPGLELHVKNSDKVYLNKVVAPIIKIIFNTPPPEGAIITADYTVPYIPKTEDYVLDVTMEIQFGEGV